MAEKVRKIPASFTVNPEVVSKARDNAWRERKSLSQIIEGLLVNYNKSREKASKVVEY